MNIKTLKTWIIKIIVVLVVISMIAAGFIAILWK